MADEKGRMVVMSILLYGRARMTHEEYPPAWCVRLNSFRGGNGRPVCIWGSDFHGGVAVTVSLFSAEMLSSIRRLLRISGFHHNDN